MTATFSAPGKIYIFGEHGVIYGGTALVCAIDLRTYVTAKKSGSITISSDKGKTGLDFDIYPYVSSAIKKINIINGVSIEITSDIPIGSGLGSSAAVTMATLAAINQEFGFGYTKDKLTRIGYDIEKDIQGSASPTDTYISTFGGIFKMPMRKGLEILDCNFVIGNTNIVKDTKQAINQVRDFKDEFPDTINHIINTIDCIAKKGEIFVRKKDLITIGKLMNINHGLLDAIGVSNQKLSSLIYAARDAGAFGAKITGAGCGGCMIALVDEHSLQDVVKAIDKAGGKTIVTKITGEGLIQERI